MRYSANSVWENKDKYDVVVIGAGHAGCEAALATARLGFQTLVFTVSVDIQGSCGTFAPCTGRQSSVQQNDAPRTGGSGEPGDQTGRGCQSPCGRGKDHGSADIFRCNISL